MNFGEEIISEILINSGVKRGSIIMLHSDALFLAQVQGETLEDKMQLFFKVFLKLIGPEGTLILPTFTYSLTNGEIFNPSETPSQVGIISEYFRKLPNSKRTKDPIFSVSSIGYYSSIISNLPFNNSFGEDSIFGFLQKNNADLICLGCSINRITFTHYVEQKLNVDYRYLKNFNGQIFNGKENIDVSINYFVRDLSRESDINLEFLYDYMVQNNLLKNSLFGRISIISTKCNDFEKSIKHLVSKNSNILIQEFINRKTQKNEYYRPI